MVSGVPWLSVLEVLAKVTAVPCLFAYLLRRGGVRPVAAIAVTLAHLLPLSCVMPTSAEVIFMTTVTLGTCSYAVLVVDRPWLRAGIVAACFLTTFMLLAADSAILALVAIIPLALWTGFMVIIREWARTCPASP